MKTTKNYIARGRQVGKFDIVSFTVALDLLLEIAHEYKGKTYVSFEVAKLKTPDENGKTHTLYQYIKEKETVQEPEPEIKKPRKTGKK
jgi:hypothetical protein